MRYAIVVALAIGLPAWCAIEIAWHRARARLLRPLRRSHRAVDPLGRDDGPWSEVP